MPPKKSFKENPALQFISSGASGEAMPQEIAEAHIHTDAVTDVNDAICEANDTATNVDEDVDDDRNAHEYTHAQSIFTTRSESKSRRLQLLIRPSTYSAIAKIASDVGTSVNDVINSILEAYIQGNK